jgi:hypothetical protein
MYQLKKMLHYGGLKRPAKLVSLSFTFKWYSIFQELITIMTSPNLSLEMAFAPRDLVTIQVGRLSANVYPKVEPIMPTFERAHAFQVIKSMLEPLPVASSSMQLACS